MSQSDKLPYIEFLPWLNQGRAVNCKGKLVIKLGRTILPHSLGQHFPALHLCHGTYNVLQTAFTSYSDSDIPTDTTCDQISSDTLTTPSNSDQSIKDHENEITPQNTLLLRATLNQVLDSNNTLITLPNKSLYSGKWYSPEEILILYQKQQIATVYIDISYIDTNMYLKLCKLHHKPELAQMCEKLCKLLQNDPRTQSHFLPFPIEFIYIIIHRNHRLFNPVYHHSPSTHQVHSMDIFDNKLISQQISSFPDLLSSVWYKYAVMPKNMTSFPSQLQLRSNLTNALHTARIPTMSSHYYELYATNNPNEHEKNLKGPESFQFLYQTIALPHLYSPMSSTTVLFDYLTTGHYSQRLSTVDLANVENYKSPSQAKAKRSPLRPNPSTLSLDQAYEPHCCSKNNTVMMYTPLRVFNFNYKPTTHALLSHQDQSDCIPSLQIDPESNSDIDQFQSSCEHFEKAIVTQFINTQNSQRHSKNTRKSDNQFPKYSLVRFDDDIDTEIALNDHIGSEREWQLLTLPIHQNRTIFTHVTVYPSVSQSFTPLTCDQSINQQTSTISQKQQPTIIKCYHHFYTNISQKSCLCHQLLPVCTQSSLSYDNTVNEQQKQQNINFQFNQSQFLPKQNCTRTQIAILIVALYCGLFSIPIPIITHYGDANPPLSNPPTYQQLSIDIPTVLIHLAQNRYTLHSFTTNGQKSAGSVHTELDKDHIKYNILTFFDLVDITHELVTTMLMSPLQQLEILSIEQYKEGNEESNISQQTQTRSNQCTMEYDENCPSTAITACSCIYNIAVECISVLLQTDLFMIEPTVLITSNSTSVSTSTNTNPFFHCLALFSQSISFTNIQLSQTIQRCVTQLNANFKICDDQQEVLNTFLKSHLNAMLFVQFLSIITTYPVVYNTNIATSANVGTIVPHTQLASFIAPTITKS